MSYQLTTNDKAEGTGLLGTFQYDFWKLVYKLGSPTIGSGDDKIAVNWTVQFDDGAVATIYNYKDGRNYDSNGTAIDDLKNWHVGGHDESTLQKVLDWIVLE